MQRSTSSAYSAGRSRWTARAATARARGTSWTAYLEWLAEHPAGFVINTGRRPTASYLMLHQASCHTISRTPARGSTFTGDYSKVWGTRDELEALARELDGSARPCAICLGRPAGDLAGTGGKYAPLREFLARADTEAQMTFAEVEALVGRLPDSARRHRAWWSNS